MTKFKIVSDINTFHISKTECKFRSDVNTYFNRYNQVEFVPLDNIEIGEKYIVFLDYYEDFIYKSSTDKNCYFNFLASEPNKSRKSDSNIYFLDVYPMPKRIWDDSGKGLVKWIICNHTEAYSIDQSFVVNKLISALNTQPENIIYMAGYIVDTEFNNIKQYTLNTYNIQTLHWNSLKYFIDIDNKDMYTDIVNKKLFNIKVKKISPYKSICYNRLPRPHRIIVVSHMLYNSELYKDTNYSLGVNIIPDLYQSNVVNSEFIKHDKLSHLSSTCEYICSLKTDIKIFNENDINLNKNHAHVVNQSHALDTNFHIVTETCSYNKTQFISEKSYKPFIMMQPFIQFGDYKNIDVLRDMGYITFDKWIDHSYDNIENDAERMVAFLKEMDRLQSISKEEWANILYEMQDDLMHNLSLVSAQEYYTPMSKLTSILLDFYDNK